MGGPAKPSTPSTTTSPPPANTQSCLTMQMSQTWGQVSNLPYQTTTNPSPQQHPHPSEPAPPKHKPICHHIFPLSREPFALPLPGGD